MNQHRFEISSPDITLDKLGNRESLIFRDNNERNEIIFDMESGTVVDILSGILFMLTPDRMEQLAGKIVYEVFDDVKIEDFITAIKLEQAEHKRDKHVFDSMHPMLGASRALAGV